MQAYLARIAEVNTELKAVTEINPDALEIAASLDVERGQGRVRRCATSPQANARGRD